MEAQLVRVRYRTSPARTVRRVLYEYEKSSGACEAATFWVCRACCDLWGPPGLLRLPAITEKYIPVHIPGFLVDNVHSNSQLPTQAFSRFSEVDSVRARAYESKLNISCIS